MAKILLLEDDEQLAGQIKAMLKLEGHDIDVFTTATDAVNHLKDNDVDCVIADLFIRVDGALVPDGGLKLISHLRQIQGRDLPIIAISGSFRGPNSIHTSGSAVTVGATANLAKPFHPDELTTLVNAQIKLHST